MPSFNVKLAWLVIGSVNVEADTKEQAEEKALGPTVPLPTGTFVDNSLEIDGETVPILGS